MDFNTVFLAYIESQSSHVLAHCASSWTPRPKRSAVFDVKECSDLTVYHNKGLREVTVDMNFFLFSSFIQT